MAQEMFVALRRPEAEWVIEHGLALRLRTAEFLQTPRECASFFVQTLKVASNHRQFIFKQCLGVLSLFRGKPINVGYLISENIKNMANATMSL